MHQRQYIKNKLKELDKTLNNSRTLLILMHDYPDPDAIASAMILSFLAQKRQGIKTRIAYGGVITRAENRALVQQVGLKLIHKKNVRWKNYQSIAMVDTQPSFGNHSLPKAIIPKNVFDHHPPGDCLSIDFVDIRTEFGTCATMLLEYIKAAGLEISVDIATALA
ncbi:DHH family phosphoesterase, partial [candidate division KSB1 bacterium]|nr:DHH family phosphoesterase [candidate division KSB1 bacterium]